jgi:hypothetical protein
MRVEQQIVRRRHNKTFAAIELSLFGREPDAPGKDPDAPWHGGRVITSGEPDRTARGHITARFSRRQARVICRCDAREFHEREGFARRSSPPDAVLAAVEQAEGKWLSRRVNGFVEHEWEQRPRVLLILIEDAQHVCGARPGISGREQKTTRLWPSSIRLTSQCHRIASQGQQIQFFASVRRRVTLVTTSLEQDLLIRRIGVVVTLRITPHSYCTHGSGPVFWNS